MEFFVGKGDTKPSRVSFFILWRPIPLRASIISRQILRTGLHCDTAIVLLFNLEDVRNKQLFPGSVDVTHFKNIIHHSVVRPFRKLPKPTLPLHFSPMH